MKITHASVVDLKTHIGRYLSMVKRGETVVVTSHRHAVARLTRVESGFDELMLIPPERSVKDLLELPPLRLSEVVDGVGVLLADRQRR